MKSDLFSSSPCVLRLASSDALEVENTFLCTLQEREGRWVSVQALRPIPAGKAVGIEHHDFYMIGEVLACVAQEASWTVQVLIEQVITNLQSLLQLQQELGFVNTPAQDTPPPATLPQAASPHLAFIGIYDREGRHASFL